MANEALPGTEPSAPAAAGSHKMVRFRNWKMLAIELAVALLGFSFFSITVMTTGNLVLVGIVCSIAGIGALWLFRCELLGVSIDSKTLTMPTRRIPWTAAWSFRRRTVLLSEVHGLIVSERWFGFESVQVSGDFGWSTLIFASRDQRRRFTALIESTCPGVAVYRIRSISERGVPLRPYTWLGDRTALGLIPDRQKPQGVEKALGK